MAIPFEQVTWVDRISDNPNRRRLTEVGVANPTTVTYNIERDDNPTVEGTPFNATSMNDLEQRIADITIPDATFTESGLLTAEEKTKLNGISEGATKNVVTRGTTAPSGGNDGDIYLRYSN